MKLTQAARGLAVIPLLALVILGGALVGAPGQVLPTLWRPRDRAVVSPAEVVHLPAGKLVPILWGPRDRAVVSGLVTKAGRPVAHATVNFHATDGRVISASTDAEGRYEARLPEGGATVVVLAPESGDGPCSGVAARPAARVDGDAGPAIPLPVPAVVEAVAPVDSPAKPMAGIDPADSAVWAGGLDKPRTVQVTLREGKQAVNLALDR